MDPFGLVLTPCRLAPTVLRHRGWSRPLLAAVDEHSLRKCSHCPRPSLCRTTILYANPASVLVCHSACRRPGECTTLVGRTRDDLSNALQTPLLTSPCTLSLCSLRQQQLRRALLGACAFYELPPPDHTCPLDARLTSCLVGSRAQYLTCGNVSAVQLTRHYIHAPYVCAHPPALCVCVHYYYSTTSAVSMLHIELANCVLFGPPCPLLINPVHSILD